MLSAEERKIIKRAAVVGMSVGPKLLGKVYQHPAVQALDGNQVNLSARTAHAIL